jgi:hypothetical protein
MYLGRDIDQLDGTLVERGIGNYQGRRRIMSLIIIGKEKTEQMKQARQNKVDRFLFLLPGYFKSARFFGVY